MNKSFWGIMIGVVALMIGAFVLGGGKQSTDTPFEGNPREVQADDRKEGPDTASVKLIEYGDFECPACRAFFPVIELAKAEFGDELQVTFRHFPLSSHQNANAAHRAAEAAHRQGRFYDMHDLLYERQQTWSYATSRMSTTQAIDVFEGYANELGLDMDQYRTDVNDADLFSEVTRHQDSGNQLNINSTPTLLINGEIIPTPRDGQEFYNIIQDAINEVKGTDDEAPQFPTPEGVNATPLPEATEAPEEDTEAPSN